MNQMIPMLMILLCCIGGAAVWIYFNRGAQHGYKKKPLDAKSQQELTAQEFVNVKDIHDRFLYTRDGQVIAYIKINPISIDLFSDMEKEQICRVLTAELSSLKKPFKFLAVSRPVDITPLINEYTALLSETTNQKQKELLRSEMMVMSNYAVSGEVVERQFFVLLWTTYKAGVEEDLFKECQEFCHKLESAHIGCEIIKEHEIVRLCNLVNNPRDVSNNR
jgi:predicted MPP superfamily phosphohydrolase